MLEHGVSFLNTLAVSDLAAGSDERDTTGASYSYFVSRLAAAERKIVHTATQSRSVFILLSATDVTRPNAMWHLTATISHLQAGFVWQMDDQALHHRTRCREEASTQNRVKCGSLRGTVVAMVDEGHCDMLKP